jgi:hypothetical protein
MSSIFARNDVLGALYATNGVSMRTLHAETMLTLSPDSYGLPG